MSDRAPRSRLPRSTIWATSRHPRACCRSPRWPSCIGVVGAYVAAGLLTLIGFFTNLFFFQRVRHGAGLAGGPSPRAVRDRWCRWSARSIIGLMARYGSERIRGHGIPEAIEAILINGSRVEPKVALLKPLSSAISIGSGGPFGAEGPIIMTGGAFGSLIAQFFHLTSAERKTLLVAGAAAGMSATFAAPLAAVLLAVELLLFEWKPRSLIPVALASATAAAMRRYIIGLGPLFPVPAHPAFIGTDGLLGCVVAGLLAGALSALLTQRGLRVRRRVPAAADPLDVVAGDRRPGDRHRRAASSRRRSASATTSIGGLLQGDVPRRVIVGVLVVKSVIWAVSLGSGTSGGVLAPLLMMGGALGGVEARFLPVRRRRLLAARQHGRDPRRHDALAAHRHRLRARADPRRQHAAAAAASP